MAAPQDLEGLDGAGARLDDGQGRADRLGKRRLDRRDAPGGVAGQRVGRRDERVGAGVVVHQGQEVVAGGVGLRHGREDVGLDGDVVGLADGEVADHRAQGRREGAHVCRGTATARDGLARGKLGGERGAAQGREAGRRDEGGAVRRRGSGGACGRRVVVLGHRVLSPKVAFL